MRLTRLILILMLLLWGWAWDVTNTVGAFQRVGRIKIFLIAGALLLTLRVAKTWHWTIALLYLYVAVSFLQSGMPAWGTLEVVMLSTTLLIVPEIHRLVSRTLFENIILATAALHSLIGVLNMRGIYPLFPLANKSYLFDSINGTPIGFLGQETVLAPYLAFAFGISLARRIELRRSRSAFGYELLCLLFLGVIIGCGSTMGFLSLAAVALVFALYYGRFRAFVVVALGLVSLGALALKLRSGLGSFSGRLVPWNDAWSMVQSKPWFGYGIGSWSAVAEQIAKAKKELPWVQLHNEYLQGLFEIGAVGMALVLGFLLRVAKSMHTAYLFYAKESLPYMAGVALFLANSVGNFPLHLTPHGMIFAYCCFATLKGPEPSYEIEIPTSLAPAAPIPNCWDQADVTRG